MDPLDLRADMPALDDVVYMNTGASGPSPRRVVDAVTDCVERHEFVSPCEEGMYPCAWDHFDRSRAAIASHLNAAPEDVALTQSTSDGIGRLAGAFDWGPDDVVVRTDVEHPAGILPWERLERRFGVEVRVVESEGGRIDHDDFAAAVDGADLVCFSSISWTHGTRLPVAQFTDVAHDAGARVLVDAVQSPGQERVDVQEWGADAVAAASHKWLLGPWGAGYLYVAPELARDLTPGQIGYLSVQEPTADSYELKPGANRFEIGTISPAPHAGAVEAMEVIEEVGYDAIRSRIERLTDRLKDGLDDDRLLSPREFESGLVSFEVDDKEATVQRLKAEGIVVRDLPFGEVVRASLHAFNTAEDVDRLIDALD